MQKEGVDAVILFLQEGGDTASALRQMRGMRYEPARYSCDLSYDEILTKNWSIADGVVFFLYTGHFDEALFARYHKRFSLQPPWTAAKAYDNVFVLKAAIEKCGVNPEKIRDCLSATDYQGASGRIRFSPSGNILDEGNITELKKVANGKVVEAN